MSMISAKCPVLSARWARVWVSLLALFVVLPLMGCGSGDDDITIIPPPGSPSPSGGVGTVVADPTPEPTEFRVAYINLMSPLSLDATNTTANDTFDTRL